MGRGGPSAAPALLARMRLAAALLQGRPSIVCPLLPLLLVLLPALIQLLLQHLGWRAIHAPARLGAAGLCS